MKSLFLIIFLITLVSCKQSTDTGAGTVGIQKQFWTVWTSSDLTVNLNGGSFHTSQVISFHNLRISQSWINSLNAANRDTTGLTANMPVDCTYDMYVAGDNTSGTILMSHTDIDTPLHNACLEFDNNCSVGACNYDSVHTYTLSNNVLVIDYFGAADSQSYGVSYFY